MSLLEGELSLFAPKYLIKKLYDRGVIINNNEDEFLSFIKQSMSDVSIYKSRKTYYLIGEDLKFVLRPNNYDGYFEVKENMC